MDIVTLDMETYWAQGYTLSSMTTESYVRDPRFEAILCSFQINNERPWWVPRDMIPAALKDLRLDRRAVLMHHAHFDGLILNHHYGVRPKIILDTLSMGRALHGSNAGLSLAKLAERYGIGVKGHEVMNARGMRFDDFAPWQLEKYGAYGCNDCTLTQVLGSRMMPQFQQEELQIMDQVIRMFTEPVFDLDAELLEKYRQQLAAEKLTLMLRAGVRKEDLMSNEKFAALLMDRGIDPPRKISPTTGKETWAFAKTDKGMQELQEHDDPEVQVLVEARLKNKTTIAEKGAERLIGMAGRGKATVYLKVSGASGTHRLSGGDLFNWQSMKRGSDLRKSVKAPPGHKCVVVDSSTIEARILDWLAGQDDMVEVYRKQDNKTGPDMYCTIAEKIYARPINKADDPDERQMGKVCLAEGTLVLTARGWVAIEQVKTNDLVWDGDAWQQHSGLSHNGLKETLSLSGLWLTPDHLVWSGTQWWEARCLEADGSIHSQALATAAACSPFPVTYAEYAAALPRSSSGATAGGQNIPSRSIASGTSRPRAAPSAVMPPQQASDIGNTAVLYPIPVTDRGFLTGYLQPSADATAKPTPPIAIMGVEGSLFAMHGETTVPASCSTSSPSLGGTTQPLIWTAGKPTETMNPAISASSAAAITPRTSERYANCRKKLPVYDLLSVGPKNRFMVWSEAGPLLVHNCKLGLGFGMGDQKFVISVRGQATTPVLDFEGNPVIDPETGKPKRKPLVLSKEFGKFVVDVYRNTHPQVKKLWARGESALKAIANGQIGVNVDFRGIVKTCKDGLVMPNGLKILYPDLRKVKNEDPDSPFKEEWEFWNGRNRERIYGAKVIENIIQCLARCVVFSQCLQVVKRTAAEAGTRWAHSVHDEGVFVVPDFYAPWVLEVAIECFREPPSWAPDLPVNCEGGLHQRYGLAKS